MDWTDEGIVLGVRRHGETSAILEVMTRAHGRHLGLVRGGSGSRMRPVLQLLAWGTPLMATTTDKPSYQPESCAHWLGGTGVP